MRNGRQLMLQTPIKLTLYNAQDEPTKEYTCSLIPWGILKKAIALTKGIDPTNVTEEDLDAIAQLVVDVFGRQFSIADLDSGADVSEMLTVLKSVTARALALVPSNPTLPIPSKKKRSK